MVGVLPTPAGRPHPVSQARLPPPTPSTGGPSPLEPASAFSAPATPSFPETPARRGPTAVPAGLPLLPPPGGRGSSPSGRWGLEVGIPGSSGGPASSPRWGFDSGGVPRPEHRAAGVGGLDTLCLKPVLFLSVQCWLPGGGALPHPFVSPSLLATFPVLCCPAGPSLKSPAHSSPAGPVPMLIQLGCPSPPPLDFPLGWAWCPPVPGPLAPACGLLRPCLDLACKFRRAVEEP